MASLPAKLPNTVAVVRRADAWKYISILDDKGCPISHLGPRSLSNPKVHLVSQLNTMAKVEMREQQPR